MYLPIELQSQILQETLKISSLQDLPNLRAVNPFFASKVHAFLLKHVELHSYAIPSVSDAGTKVRWEDLPYRLKRLYLYQKIQIHDQSQCAWSSLVQGILDLPHQRTAEETEIIINQLIDAYLCGEYSGCRELLDPNMYPGRSDIFSVFRPKSEPPNSTLKYALAASAIQRGDCIQLEAAFCQGVKITGYSNSLGIILLDIAGKKGSGAIIELCIAHGCPMRHHRPGPWRPYSDIRLADTMAESGNDVGLNVWIDHLVKEGEMNPRVLKRAMTKAGMHGQTEVMELARERFEIMHGKPEWLSHVLAQAIRYGSLDAIKYLFRRCGVNANTCKSLTDRRPLLKVLYRCPISRRPPIVRFLLENGADPNGNDPPKKKTPFEVAVKGNDFESAAILLKYGATVNIKRMMPLLLESSKQTSAALVHLLWLGEGSFRTYKSKGKSYTVCRDMKIIRNLENAFLGLGWSEQDVKNVEIDHFIDVSC